MDKLKNISKRQKQKEISWRFDVSQFLQKLLRINSIILGQKISCTTTNCTNNR